MALARRTFGRTGLDVSRLGLGLAATGRPGDLTRGGSPDLPDVGRTLDLGVVAEAAGTLWATRASLAWT